MHFVKKTTGNESEEQRTAAEKKRAAKLRKFTEVRDLIIAKRKKGEYDDELLTLCSELLRKNPDIYTFWNVRREAIEQRMKKNEEETCEQHSERVAKQLNEELALTLDCLLQNPKSYSAWHQRFWAYRRHPSPDLQRELVQCEKALEADCRNFHCWDHRRSMAQMARLSPEEELKFSDRLVGRNPSNYSAWHYRGTLLPLAKPNTEEGEGQQHLRPISDQCLTEEMKKVLDVCGVNSEDQTGWTYCRWLVEIAAAKDLEKSHLVTRTQIDNNSMLIMCSQPVNRATVSSMFGSVDLQMHPFSPFNVPTQSSAWQHSHVWLVTGFQGSIDGFVDSNYLRRYYSPDPSCTNALARDALGSLVSMCKELIAAEDNPWEVAALTRAQLALDGITESTAALAEENCEKLKRFDPQRARMYAELADKTRLVCALNNTEQQEGKSQLDTLLGQNGEQQRLMLRGMRLNSLTHLQPLSGLVQDLNLSDNQLGSSSISQLCTFVALTHLTLDGNPIECLLRLQPHWFPRLEFLSLARCPISRASSLQCLLAPGTLPSLDRICLCETLLAQSEEERRTLHELAGRRAKRIRLILDWTR